MSRLIAPALTTLALLGCDQVAPARDQWLVVIATDAPIPALGDRVLVEIYDRDGFACSSCRRAFGADDPAQWPLSFGVLPESGATHLRVRLFRTVTLGSDGTPEGAALIDAVVKLPRAEGVTEAAIELRTECFGVPADVERLSSCDPATGALAPAREAAPGEDLPAPGTWAPAATVPCPSAPPPGAACVAGGALLLGDADAPLASDPEAVTTPERLVVLAPFHLDVEEATVGDYEAAMALDPGLPPPTGEGLAFRGECTWLRTPRDPALPVNCVSRDAAARFCAARGRRLPTEAEWEMAAANALSDTTYPWGNDDDICRYAIVSRSVNVGRCLATDAGTLPPGLVPGGSEADVTESGVLDLGGSLAEWVDGSLSAYGTGCWSGSHVLVDPRCDDPGRALAVRGGSWMERAASARSAVRRSAPPEGAIDLGVRCAADP